MDGRAVETHVGRPKPHVSTKCSNELSNDGDPMPRRIEQFASRVPDGQPLSGWVSSDLDRSSVKYLQNGRNPCLVHTYSHSSRPTGIVDWLMAEPATVSAIAASVIALVTIVSWWQLRPEARLKRKQRAHILLLASYLCEFFSRRTISPDKKPDQVYQLYEDLVVPPGAERLAHLLDECSRLGLTEDLVGKTESAWKLYGEFRASVSSVARHTGEGFLISATTNPYIRGLIHLVGQCQAYLRGGYRTNPLARQLDGLSARLPPCMRSQ